MLTEASTSATKPKPVASPEAEMPTASSAPSSEAQADCGGAPPTGDSVGSAAYSVRKRAASPDAEQEERRVKRA